MYQIVSQIDETVPEISIEYVKEFLTKDLLKISDDPLFEKLAKFDYQPNWRQEDHKIKGYRIYYPGESNLGYIYTTNADDFLCFREKRQLVGIGHIVIPQNNIRQLAVTVGIEIGQFFHGFGWLWPANEFKKFGLWEHGDFKEGISMGKFLSFSTKHVDGWAKGTFNGDVFDTGEFIYYNSQPPFSKGDKVVFENGVSVKVEQANFITTRDPALPKNFIKIYNKTTNQLDLGYVSGKEWRGGKTIKHLFCGHQFTTIYDFAKLSPDEEKLCLSDGEFNPKHNYSATFPGCDCCRINYFQIIFYRNLEQIKITLLDKEMTLNFHKNQVEGLIQGDGKLETIFVKTDKLTIVPTYVDKFKFDEKFTSNYLVMMCDRLANYRDQLLKFKTKKRICHNFWI